MGLQRLWWPCRAQLQACTTQSSSAPQPSSAWTEIPQLWGNHSLHSVGGKQRRKPRGFFSSSAFTNLQRAFQAKPHLFSMKMERLWFLPVGVGELAPGSTWLWTRAPQVLLTQNVLEVLCSLQQKGVGRWLWGRQMELSVLYRGGECVLY